MRITNNMVSDRVIADLQARYAAHGRHAAADLDRPPRQPARPTTRPPPRRSACASPSCRASRAARAASPAPRPRSTPSESGLEGVRSCCPAPTSWRSAAPTARSSQADRNAIANEIDQLIKSAKDSMNTKVGDAYIFSGTKSEHRRPTPTPPATPTRATAARCCATAAPASSLQTNPSFVPVGGGAAVPLTADAVLGNGSASGDGRVLDALTQLSAHLRGGTPADLAGDPDAPTCRRSRPTRSRVSSARLGDRRDEQPRDRRREPPRGPRGHGQPVHRRPHRRRHGQGPHRLLRPVCRLPGLAEGRRADHPAVPPAVPLDERRTEQPQQRRRLHAWQ